MKTAADVVVNAAAHHPLEREGKHLLGLRIVRAADVIEQINEVRRLGEFRPLPGDLVVAEAAPLGIKLLRERGLHGECITDPETFSDGKADGDTVRREAGAGFVVVGEASAADAVIADLDQLAQSDIGKHMLDAVDGRASELGGRVVIRARPQPMGDAMTCANTMFAYGGADLRKAQIADYELDNIGRVVIVERGGVVEPSSIRVLYNRECVVTYEDGTDVPALERRLSDEYGVTFTKYATPQAPGRVLQLAAMTGWLVALGVFLAGNVCAGLPARRWRRT